MFPASENTTKRSPGKPSMIKNGDRIAQLVLNKVETIDWEESFELKKTKRNTKGLGSTGVK